ncbi:MAG: lipopolysaccharide heptosyltransferase II [Candidatus Omnitrophica bacterium]|nr:lipopolysaccharide heptosyltransferase II [Candidatus Omnitrophota bacterium]
MNRVLVVLPNWLGETLFATPFLRALRRAHPDAFLATLGWPQCREVLRHNPQVNAHVDYEERGRHRSLAGQWRLVQWLRHQRFDTAFILRKSLSRSLLLALAGIPHRIGFANAKSGWLLTRRVALPEGRRHKASTYFPLLEAMGVAPPEALAEYVVNAEEREAARTLLGAHRLLSGGPLVLLHPGANWGHKRWAPERFAQLGDRLITGPQARVALTGAAGDVELARSISQHMRHPAVVLAGRTTLRELAACLAQARLFVSNDTGVLHIASALATPLVALYGPTSPALTGPLGDPRRMRVIHHPDCCPEIPCYRPEHPAHLGMDSISVDEVYQVATNLLGQGREGGRSAEFGVRSAE